jgi:hypothetical protein
LARDYAAAVATSAASVDGPQKARKDAATVTAEGTSLQELIDGVQINRRPTLADERGTVCEIYDLRWGLTDEPLVYAYQVTIRPGQIKGWVLHRVQTDRLLCTTEWRESSSTTREPTRPASVV